MDRARPGEQRSSYYSHVRETVLKLLPKNSGSVLDVGGGLGASVAYLKACGRAERGVVVDLAGVGCGPEVDLFYGGNLEDPSLLDRIAEENGVFDTILCLDVLEHLTDPWSVVDRLAGMLRPGGAMVASIPNARNYKLVVPLVLSGTFDLADAGVLDRTHLRWFTRDSAVRLMTRSGLKLDYVCGHFDGPKKTFFNFLTLGAFRAFLDAQFYIRVIKAK